MKWFRIILATFLLVGMLLSISSVAYADDGDNDSSIVVEITIDGENPEVWINGQNLNEPTVIHQGGGASSAWVRDRINQALSPLYSWMDEYGVKTELSAAGLAKVILLVQENESQQFLLFDKYGNRLTDLESNLEERIKTLEAQDAAIEAQQLARDNYLTAYYDRMEERIKTIEAQRLARDNYLTAYYNSLTAYYNRMLVIVIGAFTLVVIGLATVLGILWRRTRI